MLPAAAEGRYLGTQTSRGSFHASIGGHSLIDPSRREALIRNLQGFFFEEFDEEISSFRAESILDFLLADLAPQVYNQAVQDARKFIQGKRDDLDGEVHVPEPRAP